MTGTPESQDSQSVMTSGVGWSVLSGARQEMALAQGLAEDPGSHPVPSLLPGVVLHHITALTCIFLVKFLKFLPVPKLHDP